MSILGILLYIAIGVTVVFLIRSAINLAKIVKDGRKNGWD